MSVKANNLPDDPAELKRLLLEQQQHYHQQLSAQQRINTVLEHGIETRDQQLEDTRKRLAEQLADVELLSQSVPTQTRTLQQTLKRQQTRIEVLEEQLAELRRHQYGKRSEKHDNPLQEKLNLFNEAEIIVDDPVEADPGDQDSTDTDTPVAAHTRKKKQNKLSLPEDLPRVTVEHDLTETEKCCDHCGEPMPLVGSDISEQLCVIPQQFFVVAHTRLKYACGCKECIRTASAPKQPLPGSQASPRLLASLMVRKFLEGLPLYRQEKIAARDGLVLPRYKQARWLIGASSVFDPLLELLEHSLFSYDIAQSDDTGIRVLKEDGRQPGTQSALWIRRGGPPDKPVVLVDYDTSKSGDTCYRLLSQFHGYLVTDGATSFNKTVQANELVAVLCNDHARRRFDKALNKADKASAKGSIGLRGLNYYGKLYRIEREIKSLDQQARHEQRQLRAVPVWKEFLLWATQTLEAGVSHSKTREALTYLIKHREGLQNYLTDPRLPISNILAEHVAKSIAIARKNFIFCDTPSGAEASAKIFSLMETAKANNHHPWKYLSVLLTELPNASNTTAVEKLLPWNISPQQVDDLFDQYPTP